MENSGESGDDGPLGPSAFLGGSGVSASYISVQSDDMEGRLTMFWKHNENANENLYSILNIIKSKFLTEKYTFFNFHFI